MPFRINVERLCFAFDDFGGTDDFFHAFLGDTMVYSAAWFDDPSRTVDEAQTAKLDRVCRKHLTVGEIL